MNSENFIQGQQAYLLSYEAFKILEIIPQRKSMQIFWQQKAFQSNMIPVMNTLQWGVTMELSNFLRQNKVQRI